MLYLAITLFDIPYTAWASELAHSAEQKKTIFSAKAFMAVLGGLLFYLIPMLPIFESQDITPETLKVTTLVGLTILIPGIFIVLRWIPSPPVIATPEANRLSQTGSDGRHARHAQKPALSDGSDSPPASDHELKHLVRADFYLRRQLFRDGRPVRQSFSCHHDSGFGIHPFMESRFALVRQKANLPDWRRDDYYQLHLYRYSELRRSQLHRPADSQNDSILRLYRVYCTDTGHAERMYRLRHLEGRHRAQRQLFLYLSIFLRKNP